ncbi:hypothetical protein SAMN05216221_0708 [Pseudomonas oryzae]|uniref:Type VI secretion protein n=1 Tax=Pseudomonas oryzae TaxID=1392877 RepID=A0A1H1N5E3_9PSED|nr:hypothetical protein SAMN05216221_0708 [Pseudomonas oryzae]
MPTAHLPLSTERAPAMLDRLYPAALLALALCLAGCSGNYKFSDDDYRPLGEPPMEKRGH